MHWSQKASRPNLITWSYGFFGFGEKKVGRLGGVVDTPWTAMTTSTRAPVMLIINHCGNITMTGTNSRDTIDHGGGQDQKSCRSMIFHLEYQTL